MNIDQNGSTSFNNSNKPKGQSPLGMFANEFKTILKNNKNRDPMSTFNDKKIFGIFHSLDKTMFSLTQEIKKMNLLNKPSLSKKEKTDTMILRELKDLNKVEKQSLHELKNNFLKKMEGVFSKVFNIGKFLAFGAAAAWLLTTDNKYIKPMRDKIGDVVGKFGEWIGDEISKWWDKDGKSMAKGLLVQLGTFLKDNWKEILITAGVIKVLSDPIKTVADIGLVGSALLSIVTSLLKFKNVLPVAPAAATAAKVGGGILGLGGAAAGFLVGGTAALLATVGFGGAKRSSEVQRAKAFAKAHNIAPHYVDHAFSKYGLSPNCFELVMAYLQKLADSNENFDQYSFEEIDNLLSMPSRNAKLNPTNTTPVVKNYIESGSGLSLGRGGITVTDTVAGHASRSGKIFDPYRKGKVYGIDLRSKANDPVYSPYDVAWIDKIGKSSIDIRKPDGTIDRIAHINPYVGLRDIVKQNKGFLPRGYFLGATQTKEQSGYDPHIHIQTYDTKKMTGEDWQNSVVNTWSKFYKGGTSFDAQTSKQVEKTAKSVKETVNTVIESTLDFISRGLKESIEAVDEGIDFFESITPGTKRYEELKSNKKGNLPSTSIPEAAKANQTGLIGIKSENLQLLADLITKGYIEANKNMMGSPTLHLSYSR